VLKEVSGFLDFTGIKKSLNIFDNNNNNNNNNDNKNNNTLYSSLNIIRIIKLRRMRWAGSVARMKRRGMHVGYWWESQKETDH
jgi:hypothetical protein